jgi:hypothetical protein
VVSLELSISRLLFTKKALIITGITFFGHLIKLGIIIFISPNKKAKIVPVLLIRKEPITKIAVHAVIPTAAAPAPNPVTPIAVFIATSEIIRIKKK